MKNTILILLISFLFTSCSSAFEGKVILIVDGDTITVVHNGKPEKIRLYGIDTPESKQAFGTGAKEALRARKVAGVKLGRPKGVGKSKLDAFKEEIVALLRNGSSKNFVADRYGTSQVNLYSWLKKNNLNVTCQKTCV